VAAIGLFWVRDWSLGEFFHAVLDFSTSAKFFDFLDLAEKVLIFGP
jgi:hypothetical protein